MFPKTEAVSFYRIAHYGATEPLLLDVVDEYGSVFSVYCKIADGTLLKTKQLILESIASFLALDLGISTPKVCLVNLSEPFIESCNQVDSTLGLASRTVAQTSSQSPAYIASSCAQTNPKPNSFKTG